MNEFVASVTKGIIALAGGVFGFLFGDLTGTLICLLIFIGFDFITGVATGFIEKNLSSEVAFKGIVRKFFELLIVSACHVLDMYVIGEGDALFTAACFLFIATEGLSIVENSARLGVPIPQKLIDCLSQLKIMSEKKEDEDKKDETPNEDETDVVDIVNDMLKVVRSKDDKDLYDEVHKN